ncbi:MAG: YfhO family protein [Saccharofermentans sp.]|nr:YfhO family protein [Saccharofermentans sp.]
MGDATPKLKKRTAISDSWPQYLLAFLFPMLTVFSALAITECYPFGTHTMLTVDCYHQYAPFLVAFRDKILSGDSLFYSWNDGLGQEYYAAYANYTASPLNILAIFATAKTIPVFIGILTCIRAGLASVFMTMFLSANDNKRIDNVTVVFASAYALCGWYISYFWNIMWCDAVVLLPLVMLGLRRLLLDRRIDLYAISLAVLIYSNYYAGYFVCLFLVMFAPVYYLALYQPSKDKSAPHRLCPKTFAVSAGLFAGASLVAAGATALLTLPTYFILQNCSATGDQLTVDLNLQTNLFDFLGRLMVAANPNIRDGMANVYCGLIIVLLLPLFFMLPKNSGITLRHKIGFGAIMIVMYLSFTNRMLNFIWHGMHFPNQIPYRESFLMSFLLVFVAFLTIRRIRLITPSAVMGSVAGCAAFLILYEKFGTGKEGYIQMGLTLLFLFIQGAVLKVISDKNCKKSSFFCETLVTVTMLIEIFTSATVSISTVADNEGFAGYSFYGKNQQQIMEYALSVEGTEGHNTFERTELFPNNICDIQSLYNVKGMSIFSSTARENFVRYMRNFGFHSNNINGLRNAGITRVTATLLGVRNLVTIENTQTVPSVFDKETSVSDEVTVYGNPDALSVGYMVSEDILNYYPDYDLESDAFLKTNLWVKSMGCEGSVYTPLIMTAEETENMNIPQNNGNSLVYDIVKSDTKSVFTVTVDGAEEGADVYVYTNASKGGTAVVTCEGQVKTFEIRAYQTITLGTYTGSPITLQVTFPVSPMGQLKVYAYQLNYNAYENMVATLADEQLNVTSYDSTHLNGTIDVKEDGLMLLTIPYSEGWSAEVDGSEAEIIAINDALMGIRLSKGSHEIKLTYSPYMFKEGLAISCACILVIALASVIPAVADKRRAKTVSPVPEQILEEIPFDIPEEKAEETVAEETASESELSLPEQAAEDSPADDAGDEPG